MEQYIYKTMAELILKDLGLEVNDQNITTVIHICEQEVDFDKIATDVIWALRYEGDIM